MRDKLNQIHKNIRKQKKEQYFKQKRTQILQYREKQVLKIGQNQQNTSSPLGRYGWRAIVLQNQHQMEQQPMQKYESNKNDIDFDITLKSIEDGEYYLNVILQQANVRCLPATIFLLGKLITKLLRPIRKLSYFQQKNQTNLVYMILTHIHNLLQVKANQALIVSRNKKYIVNLFAEDYKLLLNKQDTILRNQLISISQIMCNQLNIPPNYQLIQHLLLKATIKQRQSHSYSSEQVAKQAVQQLIMKYLALCKIQQRSNLKQMNVPYQQIIYDFNAYIQFYLTQTYQLIKTKAHPFQYEIINDTLSYVLTLQIQLINRFRTYAFADREKQNEGQYLVKESIIHLLQKIILTRQQHHFNSNELNQITVVLQQTVTTILWYLSDSKMQKSRRNNKRLSLQVSEAQNELLQNESALSMILLIKVKFRQLTPIYD